MEGIPNRKIVHQDGKRTTGKQRVQRRESYASLFDHLDGYCGIFTLAILQGGPRNYGDTEHNEKSDNTPIAPAVFLTTPLQSKEDANQRWDENHCANRIELLDDLPTCQAFKPVCVFASVQDVRWEKIDSSSEGNGSEGKVDVETPSPGNLGGEHAT